MRRNMIGMLAVAMLLSVMSVTGFAAPPIPFDTLTVAPDWVEQGDSFTVTMGHPSATTDYTIYGMPFGGWTDADGNVDLNKNYVDESGFSTDYWWVTGRDTTWLIGDDGIGPPLPGSFYNVYDNGTLDEDGAAGVVKLTIDTTGWSLRSYDFRAEAKNGKYGGNFTVSVFSMSISPEVIEMGDSFTVTVEVPGAEGDGNYSMYVTPFGGWRDRDGNLDLDKNYVDEDGFSTAYWYVTNRDTTWLIGDSGTAGDALIDDNGALDQDAATDVVELSIDTTGWDPRSYEFLVEADMRSVTGIWELLQKTLTVTVEDTTAPVVDITRVGNLQIPAGYVYEDGIAGTVNSASLTVEATVTDAGTASEDMFVTVSTNPDVMVEDYDGVTFSGQAVHPNKFTIAVTAVDLDGNIGIDMVKVKRLHDKRNEK